MDTITIMIYELPTEVNKWNFNNDSSNYVGVLIIARNISKHRVKDRVNIISNEG